MVQNQATKFISPSSPFLYLGVALAMDLNWKHQHRRIAQNGQQKLDALTLSKDHMPHHGKHSTWYAQLSSLVWPMPLPLHRAPTQT
jgi:hypothetical protein